MEARRKVLIITYYWPPSGGSGVQRWLKFAKYLREFGWEPIVYTPENPEYPACDPSLERDIPDGMLILRQPIWEPYALYKRLTGRKKSDQLGAGFASEIKGHGFAERLSRWIRGNVFIPDARRFWIRPSVRYLREWLKEHPVDAIVSTGPPHSMHVIALRLKEELGIPWLADFRDPWTNIDYYQDVLPGKRADRLHHELEKHVITTADLVTVVSPTMQKEFEAVYDAKIITLTNGFDEEDLQDAEPLPVNDSRFSIAHIGTMNASRKPDTLFKVIASLRDDGILNESNFVLRLIGRVDYSIHELAQQYSLESLVEFIPYVSHEEVIRYQKGASCLLLLLNQSQNAKGILPGKFFEYMASKVPILCLGPLDSDAAEILKKSETGDCLDYDDSSSLVMFLNSMIRNESASSPKVEIVNTFSRKSLTEQLSGLLGSAVNQSK